MILIEEIQIYMISIDNNGYDDNEDIAMINEDENYDDNDENNINCN